MSLEAGSYVGALNDARVELSPKKQTPQFVLEFDLLNNGEPVGRKAIVRLPLTERAMDAFVDDTLKFLGFNGKFDDPNFDTWVFEECPLWLKYEQYNGKDIERWQISMQSARKEPPPTSVVGDLNKMWRVRHGAPEKSASGAPARPSPKKDTPELNSVSDKDSAWEYFDATFESKNWGAKSKADAFYECISAVEKEAGVEELDFEAKHWRDVARRSDGVPF